MQEQDWLTTAEAARRLGITETRVRQLAAAGKLEAVKEGSKWRGEWKVAASSVEQWAARKK